MLTVKTRARLLWMSDAPAPPRVAQAAAEQWELVPFRADRPLADQLKDVHVVMACAADGADDQQQLCRVINALGNSTAIGVFLVRPETLPRWQELAERHGQFLCLSREAGPEELRAALSAAEAVHPVVRNLKDELSASCRNGPVRCGGEQEFDEQVRLAARLQRDFLPRRMPQVGPVRMDVLYLPASFVSGDIYDASRLDETNLGFYVADAVGHGIPAALFTMFIKKALQTKRIFGQDYEIVPPHVSLAQLNTDICQQDLSSCEFCTAVYCVLDTKSLTLTYARAGHPEPILISPDGHVRQLASAGGLLGVFEKEKYESRQVQLQRGDRLILYTDGAEAILWGNGRADRERLGEAFRPLAGVPRGEVIRRLVDRVDLDDARQLDDITALIVDIEP